jgi:predicted metal-dependent hydrolase
MESTLRIKYQSAVYELTYQIVRSERKTLSVSIQPDCTITVRAPRSVSDSQIQRFLVEKQHWLITKYLEAKQKQETIPCSDLTDTQRAALTRRYIDAAKEYFPKRVAYFHQFTGGTYSRITIRDQKTRWGSCSSKGTLSFNWRLMLAPPAILDYVVVHELCHLRHMDHSPAFWQAVGEVFPDYASARKWLRKHGQELVL